MPGYLFSPYQHKGQEIVLPCLKNADKCINNPTFVHTMYIPGMVLINHRSGVSYVYVAPNRPLFQLMDVFIILNIFLRSTILYIVLTTSLKGVY